jgi:hypothetical protein
MPVAAMGKPQDMQSFRERQDERSATVLTDVERRKEASVQRNAVQHRDDGSAGKPRVPDAVRSVLSSPGRWMDEAVQREMETKMSGDFGDVQLHTGPRAAAAAESIDARAFTVGTHVAFNSGEYRPDSYEGKKLIAHELTHVRQQTRGTLSRRPKPESTPAMDPDSRFEREAEEISREVTAEPQPSGRTETHVQPKPQVNSISDSARPAVRGADPAFWTETAAGNAGPDVPRRSGLDFETTTPVIQRQQTETSEGSESGNPSRGTPDVSLSSARDAVIAVLRAKGIEPPEGETLDDYLKVDVAYSDRSKGWTTSVNIYLGPGNQPVPKYEYDEEEMAKKQIEMGYGTTVMDVVAAGGERVPASKRIEFEVHQYPDGTHDVMTRVVDAGSEMIRKRASAEGTRRGGPQLESVVRTGFDNLGIDVGQPMSEREPEATSESPETGGADESPGDTDGAEASSEAETQQPESTPDAPDEQETTSGEELGEDEGRTEHEVESGEKLWGIAEQYYGNGRKWPVIYRANKEALAELPENEGQDKPDPDLIKPGMELHIPPVSKAKAFRRNQYTPPASYGTGEGPH